jgi:hypothetical protein
VTQGTGERCRIADLDLVERAVLDERSGLDQFNARFGRGSRARAKSLSYGLGSVGGEIAWTALGGLSSHSRSCTALVGPPLADTRAVQVAGPIDATTFLVVISTHA